KGSVLAEPVGLVNLEGYWHLDQHTWRVTGKVDQLKFRSEVWDKVCEFLPEFRTKLAALPEKLGFPLPGPPVPDPHFEATVDLLYRLDKADAEAPLDYGLWMTLKSGQWTHPLFPYPLDDVQGRLYCDPTQVKVPFLSARHGQLQINVRDGLLDRTKPDAPIKG